MDSDVNVFHKEQPNRKKATAFNFIQLSLIKYFK